MNSSNLFLKTSITAVILSASALVGLNSGNVSAQMATTTPSPTVTTSPSNSGISSPTAQPHPTVSSSPKYHDHGNGPSHGAGYYSFPNPIPRKYASQLDLTAQQKTKLQEIRKSARIQLNNVLTAEQKEKIKQARANHEKPTDLNLTEEQKTQIKAIRSNVRKDAMAVLTPEQKEKLKQLMRERREKLKTSGTGVQKQ